MKYKVGDKIKFKSEKQRYTIMACDERFIIAQKPFNARKTFLYTIIDLEDCVRGSDNYYCKYDYTKRSEAEEALKQLQQSANMIYPDFWVSSRNSIELDIEDIKVDKRSTHVYTDVDDLYGEYSSITSNLNQEYDYVGHE